MTIIEMTPVLTPEGAVFRSSTITQSPSAVGNAPVTSGLATLDPIGNLLIVGSALLIGFLLDGHRKKLDQKEQRRAQRAAKKLEQAIRSKEMQQKRAADRRGQQVAESRQFP